MRTSAFDYELPKSAIAQEPAEPRDSARLLLIGGPGRFRHATVAELPSTLRRGDLLVVNDTRVRKARMLLAKQTGGAAEVLVLAHRRGELWEALVRPAKRLPPGTVLYGFDIDNNRSPVLEVLGADPSSPTAGTRLVRMIGCAVEEDAEAAMARLGSLPLPPYVDNPDLDPDRYQTVYARQPRSVSAQTAGLHFTGELIDRCSAAGVEIASISLDVGIGTFRPLSADSLDDNVMHEERYCVGSDTWEACRAVSRAGGRVVAVGTTVVRALETAAETGELDGVSRLFIRPGFRFSVVDALLTNFHMPRSSLLVLLESFMGSEWRAAYDEAIGRGYRFLSLGDCMFVERHAAAYPPVGVGDGGDRS